MYYHQLKQLKLNSLKVGDWIEYKEWGIVIVDRLVFKFWDEKKVQYIYAQTIDFKHESIIGLGDWIWEKWQVMENLQCQ